MKHLKPKKCDNPRNSRIVHFTAENFKIMSASAAIVCCQCCVEQTIVAFRQLFHRSAFLPALQVEVLPSAGCRILRAKCMTGLFGHLRYSCIWKRAAALLKGSRMGGRYTKPLRPFCCAHHVRCITSKLVRDAPCTEKVRWLIPGGDGL